MNEVSEPQFDREGRIVCPAHVDRDVSSLRLEFGKARVELADTRREIRELRGIVTNGLSSDVSEIKEIVGHIKFLIRALPILAGCLAVFSYLGVL